MDDMDDMDATDTRHTILMATDLPVWRGETGAMQRILAMCRALRDAGFDLHLFFPAWMGAADRATAAKALPGIPVHTPSLPLLICRAVRRRLLPAGPPSALHPPHTWERRRAFQGLCAHLRPEAVVLQYARLAYLAEGLRGPAVVVDTHDALSQRDRSLAAAGAPILCPVTEDEERAALAGHDALLAIQDREAGFFRALVPEATVLIAGHPSSAEPLPYPAETTPLRLLYVGAGGAHNVASLHFLLDSVWPELQSKWSDRVTLRIVGRVSGAATRAREGVAFAGFVDDLSAEYAAAHVVLNPCVAGSGLKIKNIEALGYGRPLLTTPLGAEGLARVTPAAFLVAEADQYAEALSACLGDAAERQRLAEAAAAYTEAHLRPETVFGPLIDWLRATPPKR
jgi:glycosyltransferase involved in cell wall biosynthesis